MGKLRGNLYKAARILGDIEAAGKGKVGKRITRRAAGKMAGRGLSKSGCFIATACFGSPLAAEVKVLTWFRDRFLARNAAGNLLIRFYYAFSPAAANFIERYETLKKAARLVLKPVISVVNLLKSTYNR